MTIKQERQDIAAICMAETSSQALSENATNEQVKAMLDKRQSVGRRDIGRLLCEVDGCEVISTVSARGGRVELYRPIDGLMNRLGNCVYWNTPESEI